MTSTHSRELAAWAVIALCLSPASVFLTYSYTESAFVMLTFAGVAMLDSLPTMLAAVPFSLACIVRSNGAPLFSGLPTMLAAVPFSLSCIVRSNGAPLFSGLFPALERCPPLVSAATSSESPSRRATQALKVHEEALLACLVCSRKGCSRKRPRGACSLLPI